MSNAAKEESQKTDAKKYFFFVDNQKYDWPSSGISGAQVRAVVPDLSPTFQLILEGHGSEADRPINDPDSFDLERAGRGPLKFYSAPPATFGGLASA
jgi:hypothetical protein